MGTDKGGSKNNDYCIYCYTEGSFTEDIMMDEMIEISLKHMKEFFKEDPSFKEEEALANMKEFFPKLKRWS